MGRAARLCPSPQQSSGSPPSTHTTAASCVCVQGNDCLLSAPGYYFNCAKLLHKATLLLMSSNWWFIQAGDEAGAAITSIYFFFH